MLFLLGTQGSGIAVDFTLNKVNSTLNEVERERKAHGTCRTRS